LEKKFRDHIGFDIFLVLITKIIMIFAENTYLTRSRGLKFAVFRDFRPIFRDFLNLHNLISFEAIDLYNHSNERY